MSPRRADPKKQDKPSNGGAPSWMIPVGIGALVVIAIVALYTLQTPSSTPAPAPSTSGTQTAGRTKGDPNAKVEFVEFSDYQ
jgi:hypothetical protein